jgi:hypothetical protein
MGLVKRRLYKPERAAARKRGALHQEDSAPAALRDANSAEISMALYALSQEAGVIIGRAGGYDKLKDEYAVTGKSMKTGKAQDFIIKGLEVADVIMLARLMNGGPLVRKAAEKRTVKKTGSLVTLQ